MSARLRASALVSALTLAAAAAGGAGAQERPPPEDTEVAPGVHLFRTAPYGEVGLDGNAVAVVGDDAVLVFDSNGTPEAAELVIEAIGRLTDRPVRWVVLSHWHWDHNYGTEAYRRAFPGVTVVSQEKTRALLAGPAVEFNRPGLVEQLPAYVEALETRVREAEAASPAPPELDRLRRRARDARWFLDHKSAARIVLPDLTFDDALEIDLGGRTVRVLHYGRAVTPGDAFLHLPREGVLVTGDLLIHPVTFALGVFPSEWLRALERLDLLDARTIVPGHGPALAGEDHLHRTTEAVRTLLALATEAHGRGLDPDEARREIMSRLRPLMLPLTGDDPSLQQAFEIQFVDWFMHRVWDERAGPLSDAIAPIPPR